MSKLPEHSRSDHPTHARSRHLRLVPLVLTSRGGRRTDRARRPPGPRGGLLVGNLEAFERDRLGFLRNVHEEYGDVVRFDRRTTLVSGPDLPSEVLIGRSAELVLRENFLQQRIPEGRSMPGS